MRIESDGGICATACAYAKDKEHAMIVSRDVINSNLVESDSGDLVYVACSTLTGTDKVITAPPPV